MVKYGKKARVANDILQCGEILKLIVPEGDRVTAPNFTAYLQRCIDEKRNLFVEANVIEMGSADFAEWLLTHYADVIKDSFPGAELENVKAKFKKEEIDGDFYLTMGEETLYEGFCLLFKDQTPKDKINFIAALLTRDSTYWQDLYNMFHYATLFLLNDKKTGTIYRFLLISTQT